MFEFRLDATDGRARAGTLKLPHGVVRTPAFMPVGTNGTVRGLSPADLMGVGSQIILANAYHLHLRPGEDTVTALGGLNRFMAWNRPILTDSGGFQIFSLDKLRSVSENGVEFRSHIDGRRLEMTPESAVDIQRKLGSDVIMALDHVIPGESDRSATADALDRTQRWLERCHSQYSLTAGGPESQTLWPIIQGGAYTDLRLESVRRTLDLEDWTGIAIGGLAVGEPKPVMYSVLDAVESSLPTRIPRYLMGVGFPEDVLRSVAAGVDLFDCVAPTRNGRNGQAYTSDGPLNIKNAPFKNDPEPLEGDCDCETCTTFSRGYLRHLFIAQELLALRALSLHNVRFLVRLGEQARGKVMEGTFELWCKNWLARYRGQQ
ncbi:MAG: tRNA guanosine(34) transglycosylase Tgt [Gemmatimonadetes bacterium]|nr:tRNA guanosine(34) transglycosylase Tgt [Gemmatimonadota bacterium]